MRLPRRMYPLCSPGCSLSSVDSLHSLAAEVRNKLSIECQKRRMRTRLIPAEPTEDRKTKIFMAEQSGRNRALHSPVSLKDILYFYTPSGRTPLEGKRDAPLLVSRARIRPLT